MPGPACIIFELNHRKVSAVSPPHQLSIPLHEMLAYKKKLNPARIERTTLRISQLESHALPLCQGFMPMKPSRLLSRAFSARQANNRPKFLLENTHY